MSADTTTPTMSTDTKPFDLGAFEDTTTGEHRVRHPLTGAPTGMMVTLAGPEHPQRKALLHARQRKMRAALAKIGKLPVSDPEADEVDEVERLVVCTLGWRGATETYSEAAARALYTDPKRRWFRDQVAEALEERELFTRASVAS